MPKTKTVNARKNTTNNIGKKIIDRSNLQDAETLKIAKKAFKTLTQTYRNDTWEATAEAAKELARAAKKRDRFVQKITR